FSTRAGTESIQLDGIDRLRVIERLIPCLQQLSVLYDEHSRASGWELSFEFGRFFLLVSPERHRGFSGEGQLLTPLATADWSGVLPDIIASLHWQSRIDVVQLVADTKWSEAEIEAGLAVLGARGLLGFDTSTGRYFHRVLPFDMDLVDRSQPRLRAAKDLIEAGAVRHVSTAHDGRNFCVEGSDSSHFVRLRDDCDRCTCLWFNRHAGHRGPCKHILAARIANEAMGR
ncbi:MAG: SWIM zinc finger family protein, partial [Planctomycetota bacterium]